MLLVYSSGGHGRRQQEAGRAVFRSFLLFFSFFAIFGSFFRWPPNGRGLIVLFFVFGLLFRWPPALEIFLPTPLAAVSLQTPRCYPPLTATIFLGTNLALKHSIIAEELQK